MAHRLSRALVWAAATAVVEMVPPIVLELTGRGLVIAGKGFKIAGDGLEYIGEQTVAYAQRARFRNYRTMSEGPYSYAPYARSVAPP
jgi:hypothetical protein